MPVTYPIHSRSAVPMVRKIRCTEEVWRRQSLVTQAVRESIAPLRMANRQFVASETGTHSIPIGMRMPGSCRDQRSAGNAVNWHAERLPL